MRKVFTKRLLAVSVSALVLFLGPVPDDLTWEGGYMGMSQAYAAGGKGGHGGGPPAGAGGGHDSDSHDSTSHDSSSHDSDADSHDHDDSEGGHDSGGKGKKGPAYRGGRTDSSKGHGGPSNAVVDKILESE